MKQLPAEDDRVRKTLPRMTQTGLRFGPEGNLYCAAENEVVAFDFASGECLGAVVRLTRLNGRRWPSFHKSPHSEWE
jgi:hypothetical protein